MTITSMKTHKSPDIPTVPRVPRFLAPEPEAARHLLDDPGYELISIEMDPPSANHPTPDPAESAVRDRPEPVISITGGATVGYGAPARAVNGVVRAVRQGAGHVTGRRIRRAVYMAVPVLAVNACAFLGQLGYFHTHLTAWGLPGQLLVAAALESIAVFLSYHAHIARIGDDPAFRLQMSAYSLALVIGALNYSHWASADWRPNPIAITFALMSAVSPWLWGIHSRRESRDALKANGLIEPHAVRLGSTRWIWHPYRSARTMFRATWEGTTNPAEAIAADKAAREAIKLPSTEIEPAQLAAMAPRERLIWAWGVIGSTDVTKACTLLASLGTPIDASNARAIRRKLAEAATRPAIEDGSES